MPRTSFGVTPWEWRRDRHLTSRTHLIILLGHQLAQLALVAITKLWQARIGVGIFVAIGSLLGLLLVLGTGAAFLRTVSLDDVFDRTPLFPVCAGLACDGSASWASLAMLDEQLMKRVLEFVWNANVTVAVSSVPVDLGLALPRGLWKPTQVLAKTEDMRIHGEARALETEQCDA